MAIYRNIYQLLQRVSLLSLLLCCVDCSKEYSNDNARHIAFEIANSDGWNEMVRGEELNNTTLQTQGFGVFAYYTERGSWSASAATSPDFMNNTKVTSSDKGTSWQYSPIKYWPQDQRDRVSFFAYAPYIDGNDLNDTKIDFEVKTAVLDQIDLAWSNSSTINLTKETEKVIFTFKHALARIGFTVTAKNDGEFPLRDGVKITIQQITVGYGSGLYNKGTIDLHNAADTPVWSDQSGEVEYSITAANFVYKVAGGFVLTKDNTASAQKLNGDDSYIMVIPQDFSTKKLNIYVKYKVELSSGNDIYNEYVNENVGTVNVNLEAGNTYIINIITDLKKAEVDNSVNVTKWEDGGSVDFGGIVPN